MDRNKVVELVKQMLKDANPQYTDVSVSKFPVKAYEVLDTMGNKMFPEQNIEGYLVFVNPMIIANWAHECHYYIVNETNVLLENFNGKWWPKQLDYLDKISL